MSSFSIINSELLDALRTMPDNAFDGILCDPPYELGFMGKSWDASGVAFSPATWGELMRVCKPGAGLLAFGGTRTYHRLACAIEDAGWEIRDCIMWAYGSGFPKSMDVSKALDKAVGAEREVVGSKGLHRFNTTRADKNKGRYGKDFRTFEQADALTAPATDAARTWDGYGTALKPAYEPCILARKPLDGTVAQNVQRWGCGALWIDGGRVGTDVVSTHSRGSNGAFPKRPGEKTVGESGRIKDQREGLDHSPRMGRWPANILHDGSPEVAACFPGDEDLSAARFFYAAKASQRERNAGCEALPIQHLAQGNQAKAELARGSTEHGGNSGFNTVKAVRNTHPCVKPLDLCRYLSTLIRPPTGRPHGPRKLLVPFSGSGSEMIGGLMAGWEEVTGIEKDAEYIPIAQARLEYWMNASQENAREVIPPVGKPHKTNLSLMAFLRG